MEHYGKYMQNTEKMNIENEEAAWRHCVMPHVAWQLGTYLHLVL